MLLYWQRRANRFAIVASFEDGRAFEGEEVGIASENPQGWMEWMNDSFKFVNVEWRALQAQGAH